MNFACCFFLLFLLLLFSQFFICCCCNSFCVFLSLLSSVVLRKMHDSTAMLDHCNLFNVQPDLVTDCTILQRMKMECVNDQRIQHYMHRMKRERYHNVTSLPSALSSLLTTSFHPVRSGGCCFSTSSFFFLFSSCSFVFSFSFVLVSD